MPQKKKQNQKKPKPELVPMKAVKCPVCEGKGMVLSSIINAKVKCKGCDGKGWVEVHYAEVVKAPKVVPMPELPKAQPQPYRPTIDPNIQPVPWQPYTITSGGTTPEWITSKMQYAGGVSGGTGSAGGTATITYTDAGTWVSNDTALFNNSTP